MPTSSDLLAIVLESDLRRYIVDDSEAKIVVCSTPDLQAKVDAIRPSLSLVAHFLSFEDQPAGGFIPFKDVVEKGRQAEAADPEAFERAAAAVKPDDIASIIYTSGTTGVPKGVMLSHDNFFSNTRALDAVTDFHCGDTILSFLPLSHVLERMTMFSFLYKGSTVAFAESIDTVAQNLLEVRPTIMVSVPRLFEKLYARIMDSILAGSALKKKIFFWALRGGLSASRKAQRRTAALFPRRSLRLRLAQKLVFSKILEKTGGRVKFFVSGGAPLSRDIAEFFTPSLGHSRRLRPDGNLVIGSTPSMKIRFRNGLTGHPGGRGPDRSGRGDPSPCGPKRHEGLFQERSGNGRGPGRRLVAHRGHRPSRRRRLPGHHRPEGPDRHGRRQERRPPAD